MGTGLYDAVFAALGKLYGSEARGPITNLTLFGGFASTVCWPLGAALVEAFGWRATSLVYAALHIVVALPMLLIAIPGGSNRAVGGSHDPAGRASAEPVAAALSPAARMQFVVLALVLTLSSAIGAIVIVHLLIFLQARGLSFATAVSLGTLFGPAQVAARLIESLLGSRYHPIWTMIASCALMAIGLFTLLLVDLGIVAVAILLYAAGYGVMWIARGTLPLALFGARRYPRLMGRLALPALIAQAAAPSVGALLVEHTGAAMTIMALAVCALTNVLFVGLLWMTCRADAERVAHRTDT
jgi:predicted MFS family arabinose efflux permease